MNNLSAEQTELKRKISRNASIGGFLAGLVVAFIAMLVLSGLGDLLRWTGSLLLGGVAGYFSHRAIFRSGAAKALCSSCGSAFSISEVDRSETVLSSEPKQKEEIVEPATALEPTKRLTTTWIEESYAVTAIDGCAKCKVRTERKWTATRTKDKKEIEQIIAPPAAVASATSMADPQSASVRPSRSLGGQSAETPAPPEPEPTAGQPRESGPRPSRGR